MNRQDIPAFSQYFPSEDMMDAEQRSFYKKLESSLNNGECIDVGDNISYVFVYLYKQLRSWKLSGFERLSDFLIFMSEHYQHEKLSFYCKYWAHDCLLGLNKFEDYLEKTETSDALNTSTSAANLRINIQRKLNIEPDPIDLVRMAGSRKTKFLVANEGAYKDVLRRLIPMHGERLGGWFKAFDSCKAIEKEYPHYLFAGAPTDLIETNFGIRCYYSSSEHMKMIETIAREAENEVRTQLGIPRIGEGWVSETMLFRFLESRFSDTTVIQHGQPNWLGRQHFDVWFPNWGIAVEYHGRQHFEPIEFFGGLEGFEKTAERDKRKLELAKRHRVELFIVEEGYNNENLAHSIASAIEKRRAIASRSIPNTSPA